MGRPPPSVRVTAPGHLPCRALSACAAAPATYESSATCTYDFPRQQHIFMGINLNAAPDMIPTHTVFPAGIIRDAAVYQEGDLGVGNMCSGITSTPRRQHVLSLKGGYAVVPGLAHRRGRGLRADPRRAGRVRCVCNPHRPSERALPRSFPVALFSTIP